MCEKGEENLLKSRRPQTEELSSNFSVQSKRLQNVVRHDVVTERDNWSQAPPSAIQPNIHAASTTTRIEECQEARAKRSKTSSGYQQKEIVSQRTGKVLQSIGKAL